MTTRKLIRAQSVEDLETRYVMRRRELRSFYGTYDKRTTRREMI